MTYKIVSFIDKRSQQQLFVQVYSTCFTVADWMAVAKTFAINGRILELT